MKDFNQLSLHSYIALAVRMFNLQKFKFLLTLHEKRSRIFSTRNGKKILLLYHLTIVHASHDATNQSVWHRERSGQAETFKMKTLRFNFPLRDENFEGDEKVSRRIKCIVINSLPLESSLPSLLYLMKSLFNVARFSKRWKVRYTREFPI